MASNQLEKKDYLKTSLRAYFLQNGFNYGNYQGLGYANVLYPSLRKMYKDDDDKLQEALKENIEFFNTNIHFLPFITSLHLVMLENRTPSSEIRNIKMALMGPLAGIGDSLFWGVWRVVAAGLAIGLANAGNVLAPLIFLLAFNIPNYLCRYYGAFLGYSLGAKYIEKIYSNGMMEILTKAAGIVGLIMVGAMTSKTVLFTTILDFTMKGKSVMDVQSSLDSIFIGIVPLLLTFGCFKLLKKKVNIIVLIFGIVALGIILSVLGIC